MRRILICTGVLGGGTAITFAAAALVASLFPSGPMIYGQGSMMWGRPMPPEVEMPVPERGFDLPGERIVVDDATEGIEG